MPPKFISAINIAVKEIFCKDAALQLFFLRLAGILEDNFSFASGKVQSFCRAAPTMDNAGDHNITLTDHPLISFDDGIAGRHFFQRRVCGTVIGRVIKFPVEVWQYQHGFYVRVDVLLPSDRRRSQTIKVTVSTPIRNCKKTPKKFCSFSAEKVVIKLRNH